MRSVSPIVPRLLLVAACVVIGCGDEETTIPELPDPYPPATTIQQLLANFERAYENMNLEQYEKLLDETYEFVFDPRDVNEETGFRERWPKEDDISSTANMFGGEPDRLKRVAQSIDLVFTPGDPVASDEGEGWMRVVCSDFAAEIEAIQQDTGETWFILTPGGYHVDVFVAQDDGDSTVWKIVRIEDKPPQGAVPSVGSGPGTEKTTWGNIKALWR